MNNSKLISYPKLKRDEEYRDKHNLLDPYHWIKEESPEISNWIDDQNSISHKIIRENDSYPKILSRLKELYNYEKISSFSKINSFYVFFKNNGLQNHSVLYIQKDLNSNPEILLDPNSLSVDGLISISSISFSKSGKYLAFTQSEGGSDWKIIKILDVETKKELDDKLDWIKFSSISWTHDNLGFFYSRYPERENKEKLKDFQCDKFHTIYYHKLHSDQKDDILIYEDKINDQYLNHGSVSDDGKFLCITIYNGCDPENKFYYIKLDDLKSGNFVKFNDNFDRSLEYITNQDNIFYFKTNFNAPNQKIIRLNINDLDLSKETTIISEKEDVLQMVGCVNYNILIVIYSHNIHDILQLHDLNTGNLIKIFEVPAPGTIDFTCETNQTEFFFKFQSFLYPGTIYHHDFSTNKTSIFKEITLKDFDPNKFESKQIFYQSKDGTNIPMFLITKKNIENNGKNPFFLYGYGGFNISIDPNFNPLRLCLIGNLGVSVAIANIRGGSEYGDKWHDAGKKENKQNCFDDFIYAAKYLIKENYTSAGKIAINGASNGGLLVATCLNQAPDLFGCVIASRGVYDMLNFHRYTIGSAWISEYGCSDNENDFKYLIKYCPLHNIDNTKIYPSTLIFTSDNDNRVAPIHSYKLISCLQYELCLSDKQTNPILISVQKNTSHGAGTPTFKAIEEVADIYSFIAKSLDLIYF